MAIPRDLYSPLVGGRINAAYGRGGPELLKRAVEEATGLVAERHLIFTLEGVARVVDAVGGGGVPGPPHALRGPGGEPLH